jgi:hypothetical protein
MHKNKNLGVTYMWQFLNNRGQSVHICNTEVAL